MDSIFNYFTGDDTVDDAAQKSGVDTGMIASFKRKAKKWAGGVLKVYSSDVTGSPELILEKKRLLRWAKYIKNSIEAVFGTLDDLDGVNLGVIPLIPIAAILAALAAIGKWSMDYSKFNTRLATFNKLKKDGSSNNDASRIVDELLGDKPLISMGNAPLILIGAGAALFLYFKKR